MSIRTIVELNHDMVHDIQREPQTAMQALFGLILYSARAGSDEVWQAEHFGIRKLASRHHSDGLAVLVNGHLLYSEEGSRKVDDRVARAMAGAPRDQTPVLVRAVGKDGTYRTVVARYRSQWRDWASVPGDYTVRPDRWWPLPDDEPPAGEQRA